MIMRLDWPMLMDQSFIWIINQFEVDESLRVGVGQVKSEPDPNPNMPDAGSGEYFQLRNSI